MCKDLGIESLYSIYFGYILYTTRFHFFLVLVMQEHPSILSDFYLISKIDVEYLPYGLSLISFS